MCAGGPDLPPDCRVPVGHVSPLIAATRLPPEECEHGIEPCFEALQAPALPLGHPHIGDTGGRRGNRTLPLWAFLLPSPRPMSQIAPSGIEPPHPAFAGPAPTSIGGAVCTDTFRGGANRRPHDRPRYHGAIRSVGLEPTLPGSKPGAHPLDHERSCLGVS